MRVIAQYGVGQHNAYQQKQAWDNVAHVVIGILTDSCALPREGHTLWLNAVSLSSVEMIPEDVPVPLPQVSGTAFEFPEGFSGG